MNAAEHIVDCYFRMVKGCFTMSDVKVISGINRQLDVLAVNIRTGDQYHIECSVTHRKAWAPKAETLEKTFEKKFLGLPEKREGKKTDFALGKEYRKNIEQTYEAHGLDPRRIQRVFVCWLLHPGTQAADFLRTFEKKHKMTISIVSFRDEVIPELHTAVGTANYDDEILRSLGFLKERTIQIRKEEAVIAQKLKQEATKRERESRQEQAAIRRAAKGSNRGK